MKDEVVFAFEDGDVAFDEQHDAADRNSDALPGLAAPLGRSVGVVRGCRLAHWRRVRRTTDAAA